MKKLILRQGAKIMAHVLNLTNSVVNIYDLKGNVVIATFAPSGKVATARITKQTISYIDARGHKIPLLTRIVHGPYDLTRPAPDTYYIVTADVIVTARQMGRSVADLVVPCSPVVVGGKTVGYRNFSMSSI